MKEISTTCATVFFKLKKYLNKIKAKISEKISKWIRYALNIKKYILYLLFIIIYTIYIIIFYFNIYKYLFYTIYLIYIYKLIMSQ